MSKMPRLPPPKITAAQQQAGQTNQQAIPSPQVNEAEVKERLESARKELQVCILEYKDLLQSSKLAANRTTEENRNRHQLLVKLNDLTGRLEFANAGEGLMTLCISSLHSALILKDDINELKFQNAMLNKKLKAVSEKIST